jgi:phospholipase/lecithinase/hemolysin
MRIARFVLAAVALSGSSALAASYTGIVSFGDSLSDPGNVSIATFGALPGAGYATRSVPGIPFPVGYYTNPQSGSGPVGLWVDQLAGKLGVTDPLPFLAPLGGGTNFAIGSATTSGTISMNTEVGLFLSGGSVPSTALYTLWGGADDVFSGMSPTAAADTIANEILTLHAAGANNFLWLNLPLLGDTPGLSGNAGAAALANLASTAFNTEWASRLAFLQALGINVTGLDINALFNSILANPGAFGFTNVTSACNATAGCNPNTFLYWDTTHPTTYADSLVANAAFQALNPVPEPPSVILMGMGGVFLLTGVVARKRHLARAAAEQVEA